MAQIVETQYGKIRGVQRKHCILYKGVPYAKPPVGNLRWRAPQPQEPWSGILEADQFPAKAIQGEQNEGFYGKEFYCMKDFQVTDSEDCLYLNIWVPKQKTCAPLPVAMWIHGGAFMSGYGSEPEFDGEAFALKGVILVTVQYRLGVLGFLALDELAKEDPYGSTGNYGILDQIAALKWIHENISAFDGDPNRITVMGQSAGAMSVQALVSSPVTEHLIAGAIIQSGASYGKGIFSGLTLEKALLIGNTIRENIEKNTQADTLEKLKKLPPDLLISYGNMAFAELIKQGIVELPFGPVVDGYVLSNDYYSAVEHNQIKKIPYLLGSNLDDIMTEQGQKSVFYEGTKLFADKLIEIQKNAPYLYYFTRRMPGDDAGAFHSAELWYMFGTLNRCWRPITVEDKKLSEKMVQYWCEFIKTGNPNKEGMDEWKPYDGNETSIQVFNITLSDSK